MKIYIAGKITGLDNFRDKFNKAEVFLTQEGHLVMNPAILKDGFPWESYMPICYAMIDACEAIYLLDNWTDSKGAKLEYEYAKSKGLKVLFELEEVKDYIVTYKEAINIIKNNYPPESYTLLRKSLDLAIKTFEDKIKTENF